LGGRPYAALEKPLQTTSTQNSKLLPSLFEHIDEEQPLTVLHVGPALPETVDFFSSFRCKLHFIDLFCDLPFVTQEDTPPDLQHQFQERLPLPSGTLFDICLFWDLFNYLNGEAIGAFLSVLRPHLQKSTLAHAFSVHNTRTRQDSHLYGIRQRDTLTCREREAKLPGFAPHNQRQLKELLHCFTLESSVLLADSRLELLLQSKL
jgi:hypothetical protein